MSRCKATFPVNSILACICTHTRARTRT